MTDRERDAAIRSLHRRRPIDGFARASLSLLGALAVASWVGGFDASDLLDARSSRNFARFLQDIRPWPLHGRSFDAGLFLQWWQDTLGGKAVSALVDTAALSIAAIVLAAIAAAVLALPAARNWATPEPYLPGPRRPGPAVRLGWSAVVAGARFVLIFVRAIPEYVWAFVLLPLVGPGPWPVVLALAVHNTGILGRLYAEIVENADKSAARALRASGATRLEIAAVALAPAHTGRALLYFFYRWETCVREATVLGLLGFVSLGWYVQEARAAARYDEMVQWILLGAALILAGDAVSGAVRRHLRTG